MPRNTRLSGHFLWWVGAPHDGTGYRIGGYYSGSSGPGRGKCSCGALSAVLPSAAARRRWHDDHKAAVRTAPSLPGEQPGGQER